jgi:hypothetical protein
MIPWPAEAARRLGVNNEVLSIESFQRFLRVTTPGILLAINSPARTREGSGRPAEAERNPQAALEVYESASGRVPLSLLSASLPTSSNHLNLSDRAVAFTGPPQVPVRRSRIGKAAPTRNFQSRTVGSCTQSLFVFGMN